MTSSVISKSNLSAWGSNVITQTDKKHLHTDSRSPPDRSRDETTTSFDSHDDRKHDDHCNIKVRTTVEALQKLFFLETRSNL